MRSLFPSGGPGRGDSRELGVGGGGCRGRLQTDLGLRSPLFQEIPVGVGIRWRLFAGRGGGRMCGGVGGAAADRFL